MPNFLSELVHYTEDTITHKATLLCDKGAVYIYCTFFFFCWTNFWRSTLSKWKLGSSWLNPKVSSLWTLSIVLLAETVCCGFNWDWSGNLKETNRRRCVPVKQHRWPCGFLFFFSLSFLQRADSQYEKLPVFLIPLRHSETYGPAVTSVFICQPTAPAAESR